METFQVVLVHECCCRTMREAKYRGYRTCVPFSELKKARVDRVWVDVAQRKDYNYKVTRK